MTRRQAADSAPENNKTRLGEGNKVNGDLEMELLIS